MTTPLNVLLLGAGPVNFGDVFQLSSRGYTVFCADCKAGTTEGPWNHVSYLSPVPNAPS